MNLGITARARAMAQEGASSHEIALALKQHKPASVSNAIRRIRAQGDLPRQLNTKIASVLLHLSPSMQDSLTRLAADRDLSRHRIARLAMAQGLAIMEARL